MKMEIIVALIALVGTVAVAIIGNWDKLFEKKEPIVGMRNSTQPYKPNAVDSKLDTSNKDYSWLGGEWALDCNKKSNLSFNKLIGPTRIERHFPGTRNELFSTPAHTDQYEITEQGNNLIFRTDNGDIDTYQKISDRCLRYVSRQWGNKPLQSVNADYYKCTP